MPLMNYTTTITPAKSVAEIHKLLIQAGARQISTDYLADGRPTAVGFHTDTPLGPREFRLPINSDKVRGVLKRQRVESRRCTPEHADRVAWRILKDWIAAQLAILETEMVTIDQIMLPYMKGSDGQTVYEMYVGQQLDALGPGVGAVDPRPHSRACGFRDHAHGPACHSNCPTCHGQ